MSLINPYIIFKGNCKEAIEFYHGVFGGNLEIMPFRGSPMEDQMPEEQLDDIMHATISNGDFTLMASDGMQADAASPGNMVNLSIHCTSEAEIDDYFAKLSEGGKVTMPLADQFWGSKFGSLTDKFGIQWMLNFDKMPKP